MSVLVTTIVRSINNYIEIGLNWETIAQLAIVKI